MSIYKINRGVNAPIQFHGLKAQYIIYAGIILVFSLLLFAILYISGINSWICILVCAGLAGSGVASMIRLSQLYGEFGLIKKRVARKIPATIRVRTLKYFTSLNKKS